VIPCQVDRTAACFLRQNCVLLHRSVFLASVCAFHFSFWLFSLRPASDLANQASLPPPSFLLVLVCLPLRISFSRSAVSCAICFVRLPNLSPRSAVPLLVARPRVGEREAVDRAQVPFPGFVFAALLSFSSTARPGLRSLQSGRPADFPAACAPGSLPLSSFSADFLRS
jgi:hypothetical protein